MNRSAEQKTLVFGGAFDPPTIAHQAVIGECMQLPDFDEVWVMPCGQRFDKSINATDEQRLSMLRLMKNEVFPNENRLEIVGFELFLDYPMTTYLTVGRLALAYPNRKFWYAYGADSYADMPTWPGGAELAENLNMIIFSRSGAEIKARDGLKIVNLEGYDDFSSTTARESVKSGHGVEKFVCRSVAGYINKHRLYQ